MKKSILPLLMIALVVLATLAVGAASAAEDQHTVVKSGSCGAYGDDLTWTFYDNDELRISGMGAMKNYVTGLVSAPWPSGRITSVVIDNGVTSIGDDAFEDCFSLTSITIPGSVTSIGNSAFDDCSSLTSITIPSSVTSIEHSAFYNCDSLNNIEVDEDSARYASLDGVLFNKECTTLVAYPAGRTSKHYTISEGVICIGDGAFATCSLSTITIPDSVTGIGDYAFYYSTLSSINIPDGVTSIGGAAFFGCSYLTSITLPNSISTIGFNAFEQTWPTISFAGTKRQWDKVKKSNFQKEATILRYEVAYDANGGSGSMDFDSVAIDAGVFTLPACTYTQPTDMVFDKWQFDGVNYNVGDQIAVTEDTTVTAVWRVCEHSYTQTGEEVTQEPTCVEAGIRTHTFTCGVCEHSYTEEEVIPATGVHDFTLLEEKVITPETCKNEGLKRVTTLCTMCGEVRHYDEVIPASNDHIYAPFVTITEPSGSAVGTGKKTCTVCGNAVTVTLCQITYNAWGSATTMDSRVVEENSLFTLPYCSLTGPEGKQFQGWELLGALRSPGDQITVTENIVLTPRWAYETVEVPFTTRSYPSTVTVYRGQPVRAELPDNDIVTSYTVFDREQNKLISNTYHMWTEDTSLGNFIPDQPGTYTLQYTLSKYTETTMNVDGFMQTVKRPTGEAKTYTRTIVVCVPAAAFYCSAQPDGSILVHIKRNRLPGSGTVYLASYSTNGRLLELKCLSITDLSYGFSRAVAIKAERGGSYKAFLLDSDSGCPLAEAVVGTDL